MNKPRLLMVEDDKNYAEALLYVLEANNYEVAMAHSTPRAATMRN